MLEYIINQGKYVCVCVYKLTYLLSTVDFRNLNSENALTYSRCISIGLWDIFFFFICCCFSLILHFLLLE